MCLNPMCPEYYRPYRVTYYDYLYRPVVVHPAWVDHCDHVDSDRIRRIEKRLDRVEDNLRAVNEKIGLKKKRSDRW